MLRRRNTNLRVIAGAVDQAELSAERLDRILIDAQTGTVHLESLAGTGDAITASVPAILAERGISAANLRRITFIPLVDNTGPTTINIAGQEAVEIRDMSGAPLVAGGLKAGRIMTATKVVSRWYLISGDIAFSDLAFFRAALSETTSSPALLVGLAAALGKVLEIDPAGGLHLVGLGGKPVQEWLQDVLAIAREANSKVAEAAAPYIMRYEASGRTAYTVDALGGKHLVGFGGVSVQDRVFGIEDRIKALAAALPSGNVIDAVRDLGLDPTGRETIHGKLNRAISNLSANSSRPSMIRLPEGDYITTDEIRPKSNVSVIGEHRDKCVIRPVGPTGAWRYNGGGTPLKRCIFSNFTVNCTGQTRTAASAYDVTTKAFYIQDYEDCLFSDLVLLDSAASALGIDYANGAIVQRVIVRGAGRLAEAGDLGGSGFGFGTGRLGSEPLLVIDCMAEGSRNYNMFFERQLGFSSGGVIVSNFISRGATNSIGDCGVTGAMLNAVPISGAAAAGITMHQGTNTASMAGQRLQINGADIWNCGGAAVEMDATWRPDFLKEGFAARGVNARGCGGPGYRIIGPDLSSGYWRRNISIEGGSISDMGGPGILTGGRLMDLDIQGVRFFRNAGAAIQLEGLIQGGRIAGISARDHRGAAASQIASITGGAELIDFDIAEAHGVGCTPINLSGLQTRITYGRNPGM